MVEDALMKEDFDSVAYLNTVFPDEASLFGLDTFLLGVSTQMGVLEEEISHSVQAQSLAGQEASVQITSAQSFISQLFDKMGDIRKKATNSEKMVQEICADIKKLDIAKTHLQTSITSLKRLQMLITAVGQLEILAQDLHYREAANLLDAVKQLMASFDQAAYNHIPIILEIKERVHVLQAHLKKHAHRAFREIGQLVDSIAAPSAQELIGEIPGTMKAFSDSCLVVDCLGIAARRELLEELVQLQLVPYEKLFAPEKQHCTLDQVERRWAWFKRLMKSVDTKFAHICPMHWRLPLRLCLEFTERTKGHLVTLLTQLEGSNNIDVHALLKALQSTLRFEQEMGARFAADIPSGARTDKQDQDTASASKGGHRRGYNSNTKFYSQGQQNTLDGEKLKEDGHVMYIPTDHTIVEDDEEIGFLRLAHGVVAGDRGISSIFDKFLGSYVILERQNLEDMLLRLSEEEDTAASSAGGSEGGVGSSGSDSDSSISRGNNVYGSSMSMFVFIKNSIKRCTAFSKGATFLSLSAELKTCMHQYVGLLRKRCPVAEKVPSIFPNGGAATLAHQLAPGAEKAICFLINTGEYCSEVVPQLEQMIKSKIAPELADKVDFANEADLFMDLVAFALKVLVSGVMHQCSDAFRTMAATNWPAVQQVSEESPYVHRISAVLVEAVPAVRSSLGDGYFNSFCAKLASAVCDLYLEVVMRQTKIGEAGSQQLLLDVYNVKTILTHLHTLGATADSTGSTEKGLSGQPTRKAAPPVYSKLVTTRMGHIETVLKLVGTPEEQGMLLERFRIMWPEGKATDLQSIMQLKGLSRTVQISMLEAFGLTATAAANFQFNQSGGGGEALSSSSAAAKMMRKYGSELSGSIKKLGLT